MCVCVCCRDLNGRKKRSRERIFGRGPLLLGALPPSLPPPPTGRARLTKQYHIPHLFSTINQTPSPLSLSTLPPSFFSSSPHELVTSLTLSSTLSTTLLSASAFCDERQSRMRETCVTPTRPRKKLTAARR